MYRRSDFKYFLPLSALCSPLISVTMVVAKTIGPCHSAVFLMRFNRLMYSISPKLKGKQSLMAGVLPHGAAGRRWAGRRTPCLPLVLWAFSGGPCCSKGCLIETKRMQLASPYIGVCFFLARFTQVACCFWVFSWKLCCRFARRARDSCG